MCGARTDVLVEAESKKGESYVTVDVKEQPFCCFAELPESAGWISALFAQPLARLVAVQQADHDLAESEDPLSIASTSV